FAPSVEYNPRMFANYGPPREEENFDRERTLVVNYNSMVPDDESEFDEPGLEPIRSSYIVEPGDSFFEVSLKMYRTSAAARAIAMFNRMPMRTELEPGQRLRIPSISADGELSRSDAPPARVR